MSEVRREGEECMRCALPSTCSHALELNSMYMCANCTGVRTWKAQLQHTHRGWELPFPGVISIYRASE